MSLIKQCVILGVLVFTACGSEANKIDTPAAPKQTPPASTSEETPSVRNVELSVTEDGFGPTPITLKKGETINLVVTRKTERTCATEIVIPSLHINKRLPLDTAVTIAMTPAEAGTIDYHCKMGMYHGELKVE